MTDLTDRLRKKVSVFVSKDCRDAANEIERLSFGWKRDCELYRKERDGLSNEVAELKQRYEDLIYQVATKYPDETRHETAKRYIVERENRPAQVGSDSHPH